MVWEYITMILPYCLHFIICIMGQCISMGISDAVKETVFRQNFNIEYSLYWTLFEINRNYFQ